MSSKLLTTHYSLLTKSLLLGILAALGALVLQEVLNILLALFTPDNTLVFDGHIMMNTLTPFLLLALIIEEILKYIVIVKTPLAHRLSHPQIIWHALFVGIGFAATEIFLLLSGNAILPSHLLTSLLFLIGIFIIHSITALLIGYLTLHKKCPFLLVILIVIILHTLYNTSILWLA